MLTGKVDDWMACRSARLCRSLLTVLVICSVLATPAQGAICRITPFGTAGGDGSDWSAQALNLQSALASPACDVTWMAAGV